MTTQCHKCGGSGVVRNHLCHYCNGTGIDIWVWGTLFIVVVISIIYGMAGIVSVIATAPIGHP